MSNDQITTESAPHEVIERRLLASLDDQSKVAIVYSEQDLDVAIKVFKRDPIPSPESSALLRGLLELQKQAFRQPAGGS